MYFRSAVIAMLLCSVASIPTDSFAFDGQKKGFILGLGIGPGMDSFTQDITSDFIDVESARETKPALITDFKIGYAPNNQLLVYYVSKVAWFGLTNAFDESVTITNGNGGIGVSYFLNSKNFIAGGLGLSTWNTPFESGSKASTGLGIFVGGGREMSKNWTVEGGIGWGNPKYSEDDVKLTTKAVSLMVSFNHLWY